ncbi:hypothetical protein RF11_15067 [Thelohanellus kitauei]|uniref:Uncharacterized protein n=1 Tax=Thelohanellus kitauei TaxID=669202 RepID=A0A0C2JHL7_THEKT|nr:hypothetical protein RF11_15067 [Thelohanellus kitauei]
MHTLGSFKRFKLESLFQSFKRPGERIDNDFEKKILIINLGGPQTRSQKARVSSSILYTNRSDLHLLTAAIGRQRHEFDIRFKYQNYTVTVHSHFDSTYGHPKIIA